MAQIPILPEVEEEEGAEDVAETTGSAVEASTVSSLLGAWVLPLETPQGSFQIGLDFTQTADGLLAAKISTPVTPEPVDAERISRSGDDLVLGFTLTAFGRTVASTITLTPGAEPMPADLDLDGLFALSGTATRQ